MPALPQYPILSALAPTDTCENFRTLFNIIWSCLTTVGLCTWVSLHLNVPPPGLGFIAHTRRKIRMMLIALIAPELTLAFAVRQLFVAHWFAKDHKVSLTHGYFFVMGGFVTRNGHHPIVTKAQLKQHLGGIKAIKEEDIRDKSKGDNLSKLLTLLHVVWFAAQFVERLHQGLSISKLETATVGFVFIHICTCGFWWKKPQDVSEAILIDPVYPAQLGCEKEADPLCPAGEVQHVEDDPNNSGDEASDARTLVDYPHTETLDGSPAKRWPTATLASRRRPLRIGDRLNALLFGNYPDFDPTSSTSVPPFWSIPFGEGPTYLPLALPCQLFGATLFGLVHCWAWNTIFPSIIEMWTWRASASLISGFPVLCFILLKISNKFEHDSIHRRVPTYLNYGFMALYGVARLALLILPFTTLRDLPPLMLVDVDWSSVFRHN